ncbi:MAG: tail fiber protein [bacterium]|nr:tail fiber protein [bacterium]
MDNKISIVSSFLLPFYRFLTVTGGSKKLYRYFVTIFILMLAFGALIAQAPERIGHQSVLRDLDNSPIANQSVGVQITILQGEANGANMYRETHSLSTNAIGLLSLEIGTGTVLNGSLSAIDWAAGPFFVEQAIDPAGGINYTINQTTQLLSVPFALYANTAGRANSAALAEEASTILNADQFEAPVGAIAPFPAAAGNVPNGWLLCDGASYDATFYPALFAVIGTTYGAEPNNRFLVPDLRGRTPMGADPGQTEFASLGQTGGAKTHTLTVAQMPSHNHSGFTGFAGTHIHGYGTRDFLIDVAGTNEVLRDGADGSADLPDQFTQFDGEHTHPINSQGGGQAHNNIQPYAVVNFIIKAN